MNVPRCDPRHYLAWLEAALTRPVVVARVRALDELDGDWVVNCSGLGARALTALLVAEMSVKRLTSCSGVSLVPLHNANASPNACHATISGRLIASLTGAAAPTLPQ